MCFTGEMQHCVLGADHTTSLLIYRQCAWYSNDIHSFQSLAGKDDTHLSAVLL